MSENNGETRDAAAVPVDKEESRAALAGAVKKLGRGYKERRFWPRCSIRDSDGGSTPTIARDTALKAPFGATSALGAGYKYRRPLPCPDDDMDLGAQDGNKVAALEELEAGLAAAADGPPHRGGADGDGGDVDVVDDNNGGDDGGDDNNGGDDGGDDGGEDEDDDDLSTAHSSSIDTEEVIAFAMDWDDADCAGGPMANTQKLSSSADPAKFLEDRASARSMLAMSAYFASTAKAMLQEHQRARKEADLYMEEVMTATK